MKVTGRWSVSSYLMIVLNAVWYAVAIVLAATLVVVTLSLFVDIPGLEVTTVPPSFGVNDAHAGWTMRIPVSLAMDQTRGATAPTLGIERAEIQDLRGSLQFPARRGPFFLVNCILLIFALALMLWVTGRLYAVLRNVRDGRPFAAANAARIRSIAWAVIGGEMARAAVVFFENTYAMRHFSAEGLHFTAQADLSVAAILEGLIILVIAEVFRTGTRLDEEQSLTV